ncbi:MAG: hypothetical protein R3F49_07960 [Planctomycetota bacterium]
MLMNGVLINGVLINSVLINGALIQNVRGVLKSLYARVEPKGAGCAYGRLEDQIPAELRGALRSKLTASPCAMRARDPRVLPQGP